MSIEKKRGSLKISVFNLLFYYIAHLGSRSICTRVCYQHGQSENVCLRVLWGVVSVMLCVTFIPHMTAHCNISSTVQGMQSTI